MKENYTYNQYKKKNVRHSAIYNAVELLTSKRESAACVERNYVRRLYDYFTLSEDISQNREEAEKIEVSYITNWEKLHDAYVRMKKPEDLVVCYLSGPEPKNDFKELIDLGILPQNIWAFEANTQAYKKALLTFCEGEHPQPRILRQNIETFFQQTPKKFDIVYIDACGSIPSGQHALRCVSGLCKNNRLCSPGVVITNFAIPDENNDSVDDYYELVSQYLFFKKYPYEEVKFESNKIENKNYNIILDDVKKRFELYYGEFISAVLRDIPAVIVPLERIAKNSYISQLFDLSNIDQHSNAEYFEMAKGNSLARYFIMIDMYNKKGLLGEKSKCFLGELTDYDGLIKGVKITLLLRSGNITLKDDVRNIKSYFDKNLYRFLDKPHSNLFFDVIINQLAYPMHSNEKCNFRYSYTAKTTKMYTDVTVYDECRYIYEWLPGLHQIVSSFENLSWQYVFRFALDGLIKMRQNYNNEFFFQGSIVSSSVEGFESKKLEERINLD